MLRSRRFLACVVLALASVLWTAAAAKDKAAPLIDREQFFGDPEISGGQISPDGKFISFLKPFKETRNIWIKKTDEPFDKARPLTADTKRPITQYFWSWDGKFILYVQDQGGDENYNIWSVDPAAAVPQGAEVPPARNLTDLKGVRAMIYAVPKTDPDTIFIGLNDRDAAWHDLYRLRISTGERKLLRQNTERISSWTFDNAGRLRLAGRIADNGDTQILKVTDEGFQQVYTCSVLETCGAARFHKDGKRVYMVTNKGDSDLVRLVLWDPETGGEDFVESDPEKRVDLAQPIFSEKSEDLVGTAYVDDHVRVYWKDKAFEADYNLLKKKLGDKTIDLSSGTRDERLWLIAASSDVEPGERWLFSRDTKKLTLQYRIREKLPREALAAMQPIRYPSSDGLQIPAYLTLPKGVEPKNLPLIVFPHGGPWARDDWSYDAFAQFLSNRGYAVLQPNFRGSTGYGKKFLNAGNNEWGQKMQDDLTWGAKHLVAKGIVDGKRVGIMGGSYGGYATLAGLTFTPDLYAAGVSIVGPSNLITLLESIPPYWEAIRIIFYNRMGNPTTAEGKAQLERQSPLNSAAKIKTPLMVIQGANDPRVKKSESDQIVIALRDRGFPVEYIVAPDEGHGFARPVNNMASFAAAEKFLSKHLGGRFQPDMTPEVTARLAELTVDPKTVVLAKKVESAGVGLPAPAAPLPVGTFKYQAKIDIAGQSLTLDMTREIREEAAGWTITEVVKTPMGDGKEVAVLDKASLAVLKRTASQGPVSIEIAVKDNKATGSMSMGGEPKAFDVDLGGPLFADGAGSTQVLAVLPLTSGYTTTYRTLDLQRQKARLMQMKVGGPESVTVPAGTFDAVRLDITSAEGDPDKISVWVVPEGRKVVKSTAVMPQMGGATMTSELMPE